MIDKDHCNSCGENLRTGCTVYKIESGSYANDPPSHEPNYNGELVVDCPSVTYLCDGCAGEILVEESTSGEYYPIENPGGKYLTPSQFVNGGKEEDDDE